MRAKAGFGRMQLLVLGVVAWCTAITLTRGMRFPNEYMSAHWLLDYRFGFTKRGLLGSMCTAVTSITGTTMSYTAITVLAAIAFAGFLAAVLFVYLRLLRAAPMNSGAPLVALVFATSPFFVMYGHTFGSFDAMLYGVTIAAIALLLLDRPGIAAALQVIAVLIHELYMLTGFPLVCLAAWLHCAKTGADTRWTRCALGQLAPMAVFAFIVLYHSLVLDAQALRAELEGYLGTVPFLSQPGIDVANYHTIGFFEYFRSQSPEFFGRLLDPLLLGILGPGLLALLYSAHARFRVVPFSPLSLAMLGAALAPLTMHAVAWDTERITCFALGSAFLVYWILSETREADGTHDAWLPLLAAPVLLIHVVTHLPLMEGETERLTHAARAVLYAPAAVAAVAVVAGMPPWQDAWRDALAAFRAWSGGKRD